MRVLEINGLLNLLQKLFDFNSDMRKINKKGVS